MAAVLAAVSQAKGLPWLGHCFFGPPVQAQNTICDGWLPGLPPSPATCPWRKRRREPALLLFFLQDAEMGGKPQAGQALESVQREAELSERAGHVEALLLALLRSAAPFPPGKHPNIVRCHGILVQNVGLRPNAMQSKSAPPVTQTTSKLGYPFVVTKASLRG